MSKKTWKIPFTQSGKFLTYTTGPLDEKYRQTIGDPIVWKDADFQFNADMQIIGYRRGRSAADIEFKDNKTNIVYSMFISDFSDLIINNVIVKGRISGRWGFIKRGANYGIQLLESDIDEVK